MCVVQAVAKYLTRTSAFCSSPECNQHICVAMVQAGGSSCADIQIS